MPRCNLTLKQKSQIIELSNELNTDQLAKKFRVHPTTVTRTLKKKTKILDQITRVNVNFKTVQTNLRSEEHDALVLKFIKMKHELNEPLTIKEICDKAVEHAKGLNRSIKSKRGWWRRFKVRCNIVKSRVQKSSSSNETQKVADSNKQTSPVIKKRDKDQKKNEDSAVMTKKEKHYTFKVKELPNTNNQTSSSKKKSFSFTNE